MAIAPGWPRVIPSPIRRIDGDDVEAFADFMTLLAPIPRAYHGVGDRRRGGL